MSQIKIFIELTRLNRPIGYMLLFWPCSWGLALGYGFSQNLNQFLLALNQLKFLTYGKKIIVNELKKIAKDTVDIKGIGFYTLGPVRKSLSESDIKQYSELFEEYFLKSFSSRLAEYTNPEIDVFAKEVINKNYTIVNSILKSTKDRPEIKIDWRIYTKNPDQPLIRDLIVEGLSLARTQKEEFNSIIQGNDGDINALFTSLKEFISK